MNQPQNNSTVASPAVKIYAATCPRCVGKGYLPQYSHVGQGRCNDCRGMGRVPKAGLTPGETAAVLGVLRLAPAFTPGLPTARSLAYHLLLPLLELPASLLGSHFNVLNVHLHPERCTLLVETATRAAIPRQTFAHPTFLHDYATGPAARQWLAFQLPAEFQAEVEAFRTGQYSTFGEKARALFAHQWANNYSGVIRGLPDYLLYHALGSQVHVARKYLESNPTYWPDFQDSTEAYPPPQPCEFLSH